MTLTTLFLVAATATFELPVTGGSLDAATIQGLRSIPGVARVEQAGTTLRFEQGAGLDVRLRDLEAVLQRAKPARTVDRSLIAVTPQTIFEVNAGQCFFCAEKPIGMSLERSGSVKTWRVVDYATKGRMRFRIETNAPTTIGSLGMDAFEDLVFTTRYDGAGPLDLYWRTGGIAWRRDDESARREATESRKPLMIFPTAGT